MVAEAYGTVDCELWQIPWLLGIGFRVRIELTFFLNFNLTLTWKWTQTHAFLNFHTSMCSFLEDNCWSDFWVKVSFVSFFGNYGDTFKGFTKVFTAGWLKFAQNLLLKKSALSPTQTPNWDLRIFKSAGSKYFEASILFITTAENIKLVISWGVFLNVYGAHAGHCKLTIQECYKLDYGRNDRMQRYKSYVPVSTVPFTFHLFSSAFKQQIWLPCSPCSNELFQHTRWDIEDIEKVQSLQRCDSLFQPELPSTNCERISPSIANCFGKQKWIQCGKVRTA